MLKYRADIDGLRAIAVLSVLLYHLDNSLLTGGFVGVDIFFVISGYLITKLIANEINQTQDFSFKRFYIRRVRRLFPAMCFTFIVCLSLAYLVFSPKHLIDFGHSLIYSILSVSNFFFWNTADYFDTASQYKPLLHTWSLSVEEQFYMLWPLTLFLLCKLNKNRIIIAFIIVLSIASLALNDVFFSNQRYITSFFANKDNQSALNIQATVFYLLPFRVFEFAIGAILVFFNADKLNRIGREALFIIGLGFVLYAILELNHKMEFPSYAGLIPCLGAGMIIFSGSHPHRLTKLLSNPVMVGIGLISYSLYLIHWPIIVFYKYWHDSALNTIELIGIIIVSIIAAILMYKYVEQPFRHPAQSEQNKNKRNNKPFLLTTATCAAILAAVALNAVRSGGWLWRYPPELVAQLNYKPGYYSDYFWKNIHQLENKYQNNGKAKVLIIGDSMAADLVNALVEGKAAEKIDLATITISDQCFSVFPLTDKQYKKMFAGRADKCREQHNKVLLQPALLKQADAVILASYWWEPPIVESVKKTAAYLKSIGVPKVLVQGIKVQHNEGFHFLGTHSFTPNTYKIKTPVNQNTLNMNRLLKYYAKDYEYFDLLEQFCDYGKCQRVTKEGYLIIFDATHMTSQGAKLVGTDLDKTKWFQGILNDSKPH